jgi:hypothetical protein
VTALSLPLRIHALLDASMQTTDISVRKARKRQAVERKTISEAGASRKARKGGKLARLQDFPLDVLYEV